MGEGNSNPQVVSVSCQDAMAETRIGNREINTQAGTQTGIQIWDTSYPSSDLVCCTTTHAQLWHLLWEESLSGAGSFQHWTELLGRWDRSISLNPGYSGFRVKGNLPIFSITETSSKKKEEEEEQETEKEKEEKEEEQKSWLAQNKKEEHSSFLPPAIYAKATLSCRAFCIGRHVTLFIKIMLLISSLSTMHMREKKKTEQNKTKALHSSCLWFSSGTVWGLT